MPRFVFDIEADGLIEDATKIHCLCWYNMDTGESGNIIDYYLIIDFLSQPDLTLIGHKIITYDVPMLKKFILPVFNARLIDTLGISWYLYPDRNIHGLDEWGKDLGIEKPAIDNWKDLPVEIYVHRCSEDVKINTKLFIMQIQYLMKIYDSKEAADRFIGYMSFKLDCAREQEEEMIKLDIEKCKENLAFLMGEKDIKTDILSKLMPPVHKYKIVPRPAKLTKKDGQQSEAAKKWFELLKSQNLPEHYTDAIQVLTHTELGNPRSPKQLKDWLYSLGWVPDEFNYVKDEKKGIIRKVEQINTKEGELTDSIKALIEDNPQLEQLDNLGKINHRIGLLKGFLEMVDSNGFVKATIAGFTNTMRFQHSKPCVNLPTIPKKYWEMVRGVLIAKDDNHILCGSDMSGLEDNTKQHYMYFFDPNYVKEMRSYCFDPHCDIAVLAKNMSRDEECFYKWYTGKKEGKDCDKILSDYYARNYTAAQSMMNSVSGFTLEELLSFDDKAQALQIKILKPIRLKNKKVNFAAVYGAGIPKLAITAKITEREAKILHTTYWFRNKAVKQVSNALVVKEVNGMKWVFNPVSRFWYSLRMEKDKFSTINQSTGVYAFDTWVRHGRSQGLKFCGQFHDETIQCIHKSRQQEVKEKLLNAIAKTNEELKLNVELGISIDFGHSYADIH